MKIRKILAVSAAVMAMMAVTGCSNATEETTAAETVKETKAVTEETAAFRKHLYVRFHIDGKAGKCYL